MRIVDQEMKEEKTVKLITLRTFDNPINAHILKSRLESEGVECFLFDENISTLNLIYAAAVGGVKLNIKSIDIEKANSILSEVDNADLTDDNDEIMRCPKCASTQLYSGLRSMKGIRGFLSAIVSFSLMVFPIYVKTVLKCKECGFEFTYNAYKKAR